MIVTYKDDSVVGYTSRGRHVFYHHRLSVHQLNDHCTEIYSILLIRCLHWLLECKNNFKYNTYSVTRHTLVCIVYGRGLGLGSSINYAYSLKYGPLQEVDLLFMEGVGFGVYSPPSRYCSLIIIFLALNVNMYKK